MRSGSSLINVPFVKQFCTVRMHHERHSLSFFGVFPFHISSVTSLKIHLDASISNVSMTGLQATKKSLN